jgi:phage recombination protein Bet
MSDHTTTAVTTAPHDSGALRAQERADLIRATVAKGASLEELRLFLAVCERTGLDPLARQIHAVKRWDASQNREVMAIQTGIDGFRLVADRTGRYAPGRDPAFTYDADGTLASATSFVKKQTADGTWHEVAASARFEEYVATTRDGSPTRFWAKMPHVMLAKVAEALALRRAFPMELSGIYSSDEMQQADHAAEHPTRQRAAALSSPPPALDSAPAEPTADPGSIEYALALSAQAWRKPMAEVRQRFLDRVGREFGVESVDELTDEQRATVLEWLAARPKRRGEEPAA